MSRNLPIDFNRLITALSFIAVLTHSVGCSNALTSFAKKDDDLSLNYQVREYIRKERYTDAIDTCALMSDEYLTEASVLELCATAYAGRCGFKLLDRVSNIETYASTPPATKLFEWLTTQIADTTAQSVSDCAAAESLISEIGAAGARSADQNALMVLLSLQTISTAVKVAGDVNNDEALDAGFDDMCDAGDLSAGYAQIIGSAFWQLDKSLDALSTNTFYTDLDTAVDALCAALDVLAGGDGTQDAVNDNGLCYATSPATLNAARILNARSLIAEGAVVGIDHTGCGGGTIADPGCFCP